MSAKKLALKAANRQKNGSFFTEYSHWILLSPFLVLFLTLIILPILCAIGLSFTDYNGMETPDITFLDNYIRISPETRYLCRRYCRTRSFMRFW